jgi:hypothetical protein
MIHNDENIQEVKMKSLRELSEEMGVKYSTLYKRFRNSGVYTKVKKGVNGCLLLNSELERVVRDWYGKPFTKVDESVQKVNESVYTENTRLKKKNDRLEELVYKQSERILDLADRLAELTRNSQVLQGLEQKKSPKLLEQESGIKKKFWDFFKI